MQSVASPFRHVVTAGKLAFLVVQLKRLLKRRLIHWMRFGGITNRTPAHPQDR